MEKNIPFNSEEHNLYRSKQNHQKYKAFTASLNKCFETARPSEFKTGTDILNNSKRAPPLEKVTSEIGDGRLYVPNVFQQAH